MPANLTPDYLSAEKRFKSAATNAEKIAALEEMLSTIPRHKGTEKLQADLKRRLSKLRNEEQRRPARRADVTHHVEREGKAQIVLLGPPNSGKSALLRGLTHALPEVADYPFTTRLPLPGMAAFEDVPFQLVDLPPLHPEFTEAWVFGIVRNADAALLVVDLGDPDLLEELEASLALLSQAKVQLGGERSPEGPGWTVRPAILVGNKSDRPEAAGELEVLRDLYGARFPIVVASAGNGDGLDALRRAVFDLLGVVRVYTKPPGKKFERTAPYVLKRGSHLADLAALVHHDFVAHLKFARVWGHGKFEGQMVNRDYILADGDVIELHT